MKIIHNWPRYNPQVGKVERVGTDEYTEADVWQMIRAATLETDHKRDVVVINTLSESDSAEIQEEMDKKSYDPEQVEFKWLADTVQKIRVPGRVKFVPVSRTAQEIKDKAPRRTLVYPIVGHYRIRKIKRWLHLGNRHNLELVKKILREKSDPLLVIWQPEETEGLQYLPELEKEFPHLEVIVFHCGSDKWGVEVSGDPDNYEDEFPALSDLKPEPKEVIVENMLIRGNIHVVAGPPEAFKTMGVVEVSSAILDERPAFDLLKTHHRYPILFLCADMSPSQLNEWAAPFNLQKHGSDFRVMRGTNGIPKVDDPVLQRAVRGRILVLDTMLDFARIQKAFESGEWTSFMENLRNLMKVHGCVAVIMTAHSTRAEVKSDSDTINKGEYFKDSVTFHGKTDIGFGCKVLKGTSQVKWERTKGRGFKYGKFSFAVAVYDSEGNSNLDRGRFPVCTRPENMKEMQEQRQDKGGRKANPEKDAITKQMQLFKNEGKSLPEIAELTGKSISTVKRYLDEFDAPKGDEQ